MELNISISVLCIREYDIQGSKDFVKLSSTINVYLQEKQQFSPLYSYMFPRSGKKIRERSQATKWGFWELNYPKYWTGSPSEVDLGGHAYAFVKFSAQYHKAVCEKLPSRKQFLPKPDKKNSKLHKMLITNLLNYQFINVKLSTRLLLNGLR